MLPLTPLGQVTVAILLNNFVGAINAAEEVSTYQFGHLIGRWS